MNVLLWGLQIVLALAFGMAGVMKISTSRTALAEKMPWVNDFSGNTVKLIGTVELLAAIGLILPAATGVAPVLTPLAATGLAVVMVLAAATHVRRHEPSMLVVNGVLFVLAVVVAWGRFGPYSF